MANITEELNNPQWSEGIYQLETTAVLSRCRGGLDGGRAKNRVSRVVEGAAESGRSGAHAHTVDPQVGADKRRLLRAPGGRTFDAI